MNPAEQRAPVAWVLNLDAEHELEVAGAYTPSAHVRSLVAREQQRVMPGLIRAGDVLLDPSAPDFEARLVAARGLEGRCWSPTPSALALLARAGAGLPLAPPIEVLRRVNARHFAAELRAPLAGESFEKCIVQDLDSALLALARAASLGWLVRRPFGAAGRGRRRIHAGRPDAGELAWLVASLRLGPLTIEPFVEIECEYSRSGYVDRVGGVRHGTACFQTVDRQGAWVRSQAGDRFDPIRSADEQVLAQTLENVGRALFQAGYHGPFGIDAYRHRGLDSARTQLNPLSEINARYTMDFGVDFGAASGATS